MGEFEDEHSELFSSLEDSMDGRWNVFEVSTDAFRGEVLNFMALPTEDVGQMFGKKVHGPASMIAAIEMLKKCILDKTDRQRFEALSFAEALEVVSQWHVLSTKAEEQRSKDRLAEKIAETKDKMRDVLESVGLPADLLDGIELEDGSVIGEDGDTEDDGEE